jgi:nucleoside-diphosphate-sugar epimerase
MDMKIFILSSKSSFSDLINSCLKEYMFDITCSNEIKNNLYNNIVIINLLKYREDINFEIDCILRSNCHKIILLENAMDLYFNSKNKAPFSVYDELLPKNEICSNLLNIENKIINSNKQYVIFRVADIYGPSISDSIVNKLCFSNLNAFENSKHDFIYEGDVMQAIEIALKQSVIGLFDIASEKTINLKYLNNIIEKTVNKNIKIEWTIKRQNVSFNCDNFKFYGWQPLINLEMGVKTLFSLRRK